MFVMAVLALSGAAGATSGHGAGWCGARRAGCALALRPRAQGLSRHRENTTSKVWFTVANGVLSDVYYPTVDNTNVETLQYIVSDGSTFTDLQTRDMTYTRRARSTARAAWACEVTATAKSGKYRIVHRLHHRSRAGTRC